jgi:hypothetical protein
MKFSKFFSIFSKPKSLSQINTPSVVAPAIKATTANKTRPTVAIVNSTTVLKDADVVTAIPALQIQVDRDFAPVWGIGADLVFVGKNGTIPEHAWVLYLLDHSDQQGALGYHDLTTAGNPVGKVFAGDDKAYGLSWTVTLSHELLEMLVDPFIVNCVFAQQTNTTGTLYALECCDATEDDQFGYTINGVLVSDFVYPAWFESFREPHSTQFSFGNVVHSPFELAEGGYIGAFEVGPNSQGWTQLTPASGIGRRLAAKGPYSRKARRAKPKV